MQFKVFCYFVLGYSFSQVSPRIFKNGGAEKLLNAKMRTVLCKPGQEARLTWIFQTNKKISFYGIVWTIYDRIHKNYTKLVWINKHEKVYRHFHTKGRSDFDVNVATKTINTTKVQLTIIIPNVQDIHENKYVCHVIRSKIGPSQIELKVEDLPLSSTTTTSPNFRSPQISSPDDFRIAFSNWKLNGKITTLLGDGNTTIVLENSKVTLTCSVAHLVRLAWFKDNVHQLVPFKGNNVSFTKTFSKEDEGKYECVGRTHETEITKTITIYVRSRSLETPTKIHYGSPVTRGTSSHLNIKQSIIVVTSSVGLVPVVVAAILLYRRRRRCMETKRNVKTSVQNTDMEPIISPESNHFNTSGESTVFYKRDSLDDGITTITFGDGLLLPESTVRFSRVQQRSDNLILRNGESYEIDPGLLQDMVLIGEGAFGIVAKATLLKEKNGRERKTVAVKMLKEIASPEDKQDLISELKIMRDLEPHKNVVGLIGYVTKPGQLCVVIEYVAGGDLLGFLRKTRGLVDTIYVVPNHIQQSHLSQCQLLEMACNVASGMAHLSRNHVIHRDLAARNVLVGANLACKITDFGMARDAKSSNYYRKKSRGRIPLKWTAIEALVDEKYTTESDIWSFGILLYEIVTMGGKPYPGLGASGVIRRLKSGWRMPKPAHVDSKLYQIMLNCWSKDPGNRPSFSVLERTLASFSRDASDYINISDYDGNLYLDTEGNNSLQSDSQIDV
ncbi:fibroblast growth factor receptor 1-like isoform X2 [Dendronephthya gigantea]|uniref:fibroblast growth factor receptor 1-like isoform X2 n=1 Tax=Dendronephthya gigantea TaxID=151771 RepID=UPI00106C6366|nr:fibroblast growth factor receptor 1-like isoform X2 [Dendronephthya gigantea]